MKNIKPKVILTTDHWATICWAIPSAFILGTLIFFIIIFIEEGKLEPISFFIYWLLGVLLCSIICVLLLVKRLYYFININKNGFATQGKIIEISRGGVHYTYEYLNTKHESTFSTSFKKQELLNGINNITVIIDKNNPERNYIKDLIERP